MPVVAVIPEPNARVELRMVPTPELEKNAALRDVELPEVCGTDVYLQRRLLQGVPFHDTTSRKQTKRWPQYPRVAF